MLIKSYQSDTTIELYRNIIFEGTDWEHVAYTVVTDSFSRSYQSLEDANMMFEQLVSSDGLWH
jgi:hypothetical protein